MLSGEDLSERQRPLSLLFASEHDVPPTCALLLQEHHSWKDTSVYIIFIPQNSPTRRGPPQVSVGYLGGRSPMVMLDSWNLLYALLTSQQTLVGIRGR